MKNTNHLFTISILLSINTSIICMEQPLRSLQKAYSATRPPEIPLHKFVLANEMNKKWEQFIHQTKNDLPSILDTYFVLFSSINQNRYAHSNEELIELQHRTRSIMDEYQLQFARVCDVVPFEDLDTISETFLTKLGFTEDQMLVTMKFEELSKLYAAYQALAKGLQEIDECVVPPDSE